MQKKISVQKFILFIAGLFIMGLGVALTKKGELGVSPVSSVANIMSIYCPSLTLGKWLIIWNCVLIAGQVVILRRNFKLIQLLQIPLSLMFGFFTDIGTWLCSLFNAENYAVCISCVFAGTVVIGFGVAMIVHADLIMNSGEAFVKAVSETCRKEFGTVKIAFDVSCVILSVILSLIFFDGRILGTREGTLIAALLTGCWVKFFMKFLFKNRQ